MGVATGYARKPALVVLKGTFSRRISELKLPKHQILKLAQSKGYNATKASFNICPVPIPRSRIVLWALSNLI
jgi:hypothetical protein